MLRAVSTHFSGWRTKADKHILGGLPPVRQPLFVVFYVLLSRGKGQNPGLFFAGRCSIVKEKRNGGVFLLIAKVHSCLGPGAARYTGPPDNYVRFAMEHQLLDAQTWEKFVQVFREDSDDFDKGWRGEYWGKMMRGACLTYAYNADEALYAVLETTVRDLLTAQRADGRFSTYSSEAMLDGWDLWGRKYVLTALLHFWHICQDKALKAEIIAALCRHADAILATVGPEKRDITKTSTHWGGVNSCSILDAILELYQITGKAEYLEFGRYILSTGGCEYGDLIALALENRVMPYEYPEVKAYETMSFFEGVLTYYEITGEEAYLRAVLNFVEAVKDTDITVIGCSGCTHELFDRSAQKQVLYSEGIMQETCVTVTWMRLMARLHLLTGEAKYMDRMELSAWNALYGSANTGNLKQLSMEERVWMEPLPFDSYSPLCNNARGRGIGGFKKFRFGGYYGCCACIASAGIAVYPLFAAMETQKGLAINSFLSGMIRGNTPGGQTVTLHTETGYPARANWSARMVLAKPEKFELKIRIPDCWENGKLTVNGAEIPVTAGYTAISRVWNDGDSLVLTGAFTLKIHRIEGRTAFAYGPLTLARDAAKENGADLEEEITLAQPLVPTFLEPQGEEHLRLILNRTDGKAPMLLTDYASCGKNWFHAHNRMTVWMNVIM